ncbi:MAG TPA: rod shape-determining protein RodA [Thermoanaerobacterales bacterium]|nr:rod shape-determining protein RodA [Thermoanaerobacterales bacterium]
MIDKRLLKRFDYGLLILVVIISCIGIIIISSATNSTSAEAKDYYYVKMQLMWFAVGLAAMLVAISIDYRVIGKYVNIIYVINIIFLLVVFFAGKSAKGATRWIMIGPFRFQPSEFAKIATILTLAKYIEKKEGNINDIKELLLALLYVGFPIILIMKQPDLGSSMVLLAIFFVMMFAGGANIKLLSGLILSGVLLAPIAWFSLEGFQKKRILVFLNPNMDPLGAGYHVIQSKIAVGSGGLLGKGLYRGTQNQLQFLPEQHTDFIFSVLGEELGFIGGILLLVLYLFLILRMLNIASKSKDLYGMLIIVGVITMFTFHIFINIGMTIGIMPITGLPLPFMSYGGSSFITNMIAVGLVLNVGMRRYKILF